MAKRPSGKLQYCTSAPLAGTSYRYLVVVLVLGTSFRLNSMKSFTTVLVALYGSSFFHGSVSLTPTRTSVSGIRSDPWIVKANDDTLHLQDQKEVSISRRRQFLGMLVGTTTIGAWLSAPNAAVARYVLDDETGEYVELEDADWQTAWRQRLDKASSMSTEEIFQAARGAGNVDLKAGTESDASKKRRAMSACRDTAARNKANAGTEKDCNARVFAGEVEFILDAL